MFTLLVLHNIIEKLPHSAATVEPFEHTGGNIRALTILLKIFIVFVFLKFVEIYFVWIFFHKIQLTFFFKTTSGNILGNTEVAQIQRGKTITTWQHKKKVKKI